MKQDLLVQTLLNNKDEFVRIKYKSDGATGYICVRVVEGAYLIGDVKYDDDKTIHRRVVPLNRIEFVETEIEGEEWEDEDEEEEDD